MGFWTRIAATAAFSCLGIAAASAAERLTPLDVALGDVSLNKVSFLIAADRGLYAKYGLDVHQFITPGAAQVAASSGVIVPKEYVKQDIGSAPISIGGGSPMIYRVITTPNAIDRVLLATDESIIRDHIIATPNVSRLEDLKGKRLGYSVPGAVTHVGALSLAKHMGWQVGRDITLVGGGNGLNHVRDGKEDAFLASAIAFAMAPEVNLKDVIDLTQYKFPVAGSSILAEKKWYAANKDTAVRFVKAHIESVALMKTNKAAFNAALAKWFNVKDAKAQARMYEEVDELPQKPYPTVEGIKATMAFYDTPEMKKHKAEDWYDSSIMTELDKSGFIDGLYKK